MLDKGRCGSLVPIVRFIGAASFSFTVKGRQSSFCLFLEANQYCS